MTIAEYIKRTGEARIASALGVSIWAVRSWRLGTRLPRHKQANALIAYSGGEVSLADIYAPRSADVFGPAPDPEARDAA